MRRILALAVILAIAVPAVAQQSVAQQSEELYLEITRPGLSRVAVAAPPFLVVPGTSAATASELQAALDEDLRAAAPIAMVDPKLYRLVENDPRPEIVYQRWRAIGAQFLLTGSIARAGGQLVVEARLVELSSGEYAFAKRYRAPITAVRVLAHTLANDLVKVFTGRPGPFLSRIAFVSDRSGHPELWVMDWDGSNQRQLTKHGSIAVGPAWSPEGTMLAFTSYLRGGPALYLLKPQEGYLRRLWERGGVNSSPAFSPDGKRIAFASSRDGNVDIYVIPTEGGTPQRLTTARAIDTQPTWAPNGRQIAFTSTRSGTPQIYLMDSDGANVRRVTLEGDFFDEATFAPDGLRLAATTKIDNHFQLCTIDIASGKPTVIPAPGNNESPCFSPDGSMLVFSSDRSGTPQIYVTDADGHPRRLTTQGSNHSPTWAPAP